MQVVSGVSATIDTTKSEISKHDPLKKAVDAPIWLVVATTVPFGGTGATGSTSAWGSASTWRGTSAVAVPPSPAIITAVHGGVDIFWEE